MFADLMPAGLLWLGQRGMVRRLTAGELVMEKGAYSDHLALVLEGQAQVRLGNGDTVLLGPGQAIGEIEVLTGQPRIASVVVGSESCRLLMLPAVGFEEMVRRSSSFSRSLLSQLALRLANTTRKVPG